MSDESSSDSEKYDEAQSCDTSSTLSVSKSTRSLRQLSDFSSRLLVDRHRKARVESITRCTSQQFSRRPTTSARFFYNSESLGTVYESPDNIPQENDGKFLKDKSGDETSSTLSWQLSSTSSLDIFEISSTQSERFEKLEAPIYNKRTASPLRDQLKLDNTNTLNSACNGTPRKEYRKIWKNSSDTKKGIVSLLKDYIKGENTFVSSFSLIMSGHLNRPYIKEVRSLLHKAKTMNAEEMVDALQEILNKNQHNSQCSLQKRLDFIKSQAPELFTSTPSPNL